MSLLTKANLDSVFHAYDVRGEDPKELNEDFFYHLGKAFVTYLDAKNIAIGRDFRETSEKYQKAFIKGARELGCSIKDIGEIGTEMLYFAVGSDDTIDGGATITASHNPSGWNGCKMVGRGASALSGEEGLPQIKELMLNQEYKESKETGTTRVINIYPTYKEKILSFLGNTKIKPLKLVVDAGNGIGGQLFDYVFGDLGLNYEKMYFKPDSNFPNHVPNPMEEENILDLRKQTVETKADIGIAIDGDADRVQFIDNAGRNPSGIYTGAVLAKALLEENPGAYIIQDPRITWPVTNEVNAAGGKTMMTRAGHSFFKKKMRELDAIFGAEASSHFYYKDFYFADSGMVTIAIMLKLLSEGLDFDDTIAELYAKYPNSGEVNYEVDNADDTLAKLEDHFEVNHPDAKISHIDGVSIEFNNWRFNLRPSNTQPLIRLNLEAKDIPTILEKFPLVEELIEGKRQNQPGLKELKSL